VFERLSWVSLSWRRAVRSLVVGLAAFIGVGLAGGGAEASRPASESAPAVAATFLRDSYLPDATASFVLWQPEKAFTLQLFHVDASRWNFTNTTLVGQPVAEKRAYGATAAHVPTRVRLGDWPSGLYFARLEAGGLVGFAPFVVRPKKLGEHDVLVVLPTYTWQAYNFRDDNHDGRADTWYAGGTDVVRLDRPFLDRGVPPHFRRYDLPFLRWLQGTGKQVDFFADSDLDDIPHGGAARGRVPVSSRARAGALAAGYRLIVFPGHHEYVTEREFDVVSRYRDLGGHLMFLSANNFFWKVERQADTIVRTWRWRRLGRPEASLIGVQYVANDGGKHQGSWQVTTTSRVPWLFAGTGLKVGSEFGWAGVEIDHTAPASPTGTIVVAKIPKLMSGHTAEMTYYETKAGAQVFAAGAFRLGGGNLIECRILQNLWNHLAGPAAGSCQTLFPGPQSEKSNPGPRRSG